MVGYSPLYIKAFETGLVQSRENFILPDDAYPVLENAYVWRERIKRKLGYQLLGRLQRQIGTTDGSGNASITISPIPIVAGNSSFTVGTNIFTDSGTVAIGLITLLSNGPGSATLNLTTGVLTITGSNINTPLFFIPRLPVMGIRARERNSPLNDETVIWDTIYAYNYDSTTNAFEEFLPGTTWSGTDADFFWTTNYWVDKNNFKVFWATNYSLTDPIRYCNGQTASNWVDFAPIINAAGDQLFQTLALLPFRGRLVAFNTSEGNGFPGLRFTNRIRWAAIGTPFTIVSPIVTAVNANAWRDDIRGQGGFLDIPTNEDIVSVGFVRDNLVIYCEQSTWQLRYTGRTIAPFQIEKVNSELGARSTFSAIQFDTSLVGIGDKGIVECDSYKSERIDIKIPDFAFTIQNGNDPADPSNGRRRIHGVRDFFNRLAYWIYPFESQTGKFPNKRLVYNYENDSWAIFTDSLTALGTYNVQSSRNWINTKIPWIQCKFPWINQPIGDPVIIGGNQQGFIEILDEINTNDPSLSIHNITGNSPNPTSIYSRNHNMETDFVIKITNIPTATPFATALNGKVFSIVVTDKDNFTIFSYNSVTGQFSDPQVSSETGYKGGGLISVRDNFNITSKKFNFLDDGQNIQMGYLDILMDSTANNLNGSISLNVFLNYDDNEAINTLPQNTIARGFSPNVPDTFFNEVIPTAQSPLSGISGDKYWQRVFCGVRGNFITIQYTFNNAQMAGIQQELDVQIDSQILWIRRAGKLNPVI